MVLSVGYLNVFGLFLSCHGESRNQQRTGRPKGMLTKGPRVHPWAQLVKASSLRASVFGETMFPMCSAQAD
eukprot:6480323-Amphidinium_carterae.1